MILTFSLNNGFIIIFILLYLERNIDKDEFYQIII